MNSDETISIYQAIVKAGDQEYGECPAKSVAVEENGEASPATRLKKDKNTQQSQEVHNQNYGGEFWIFVEKIFAAFEYSKSMVLPTLFWGQQHRRLNPPGIIFVETRALLPKNMNLLPGPASSSSNRAVKSSVLNAGKSKLVQLSRKCRTLFDGGSGLVESSRPWMLLKARLRMGMASKRQAGKLVVSKQRPPGAVQQDSKRIAAARYDFTIYEILKKLRDVQRIYYSGAKMLLGHRGVESLQHFSARKKDGRPGPKKRRESEDERNAKGGKGPPGSLTKSNQIRSEGRRGTLQSLRSTSSRSLMHPHVKKMHKGSEESPLAERWALGVHLYRKYFFHKRDAARKKAEAHGGSEAKNKEEGGDSTLSCEDALAGMGDSTDRSNRSSCLEREDTEKSAGGEEESESQHAEERQNALEHVECKEIADEFAHPRDGMTEEDAGKGGGPQGMATTDKYGFFITINDPSAGIQNGLSKKGPSAHLFHRRHKS